MIKQTITATLLAVNLMITSPLVVMGNVAFAQDTTIQVAPTPPMAPTPPVAPTPPSIPLAPTPPPVPTFVIPTPPPMPVYTIPDGTSSQSNPTPPQPDFSNNSGSQTASYATGDSTIVTGDANANGSIYNSVNNNVVNGSNGSGNAGSTGIDISNSNNGVGSVNNGSVNSDTTMHANLSNDATVDNQFIGYANSGKNDASYNTGNGAITTGDANVSGTVVNGINTNTFGTSEFTVAGDHVGDIVLLAPPIGNSCTASCVPGNLSAQNSDNGAFTDNNAQISTSNSADTTLSNNANLVNNVTLTGVSGGNNADYNVGAGSVTTGDVNAAANVLNAVNTNVSGGGLFVVNIVGNLVGDIVLPALTQAISGNGSQGQGTNVANTGNGTGSQNNAGANISSNQNTTMTNDATIANNITLNGTTGSNTTGFNNGNNGIDSGNVTLSTNLVNVANVNVQSSDQPIWIVFINEIGSWAGNIMGAPEGQTMAASDGMQFTQNPNGTVNATNNQNGAFSHNNASVSSSNDSNTTLSNTANVTNNITVNGDSGHNSASYNVGGSSVTTGNVNAAVNAINLVNNNFAGRPVYVLVINVFGKWVGNVVDKVKDHGQGNSQGHADNSGANQQNTANTQQNQAVGGANVSGNIQPTPQGSATPSQMPTGTVVTTGKSQVQGTATTNGNKNVTMVSSASFDGPSDGGNTLNDASNPITVVAHKAQNTVSVYWPFVVIALLIPVLALFSVRMPRLLATRMNTLKNFPLGYRVSLQFGSSLVSQARKVTFVTSLKKRFLHLAK